MREKVSEQTLELVRAIYQSNLLEKGVEMKKMRGRGMQRLVFVIYCIVLKLGEYVILLGLVNIPNMKH